MSDSFIHDSYYECDRSAEEAQKLYADYLKWCSMNGTEPEVETFELVDYENMGHIAYHAEIFRKEKAKIPQLLLDALQELKTIVPPKEKAKIPQLLLDALQELKTIVPPIRSTDKISIDVMNKVDYAIAKAESFK